MRYCGAVKAVAAVLAVLALAPPAAVAGPQYVLQRCAVDGHNLNIRFATPQGKLRRFHLTPTALVLSGDVKGTTELANIQELRLDPGLAVAYRGGGVVAFGPLTPECAAKLRAAAAKHRIPLREEAR